MNGHKVRYTWSRYAHNPVEHAFDNADQFARPLCGASLSLRYQHIADQPSGLARLCQHCQDKLKKLYTTDGHTYIGDGTSGCDAMMAGKVRCGAGIHQHPAEHRVTLHPGVTPPPPPGYTQEFMDRLNVGDNCGCGDPQCVWNGGEGHV